MNSPKIINHCGNAVDISKVKSIQLVRGGQSIYYIVFDLSERAEFIFNPGTKKWEKEIFTDVVKIEYDDHEMATIYMREWAEIWQDYADSLQHAAGGV